RWFGDHPQPIGIVPCQRVPIAGAGHQGQPRRRRRIRRRHVVLRQDSLLTHDERERLTARHRRDLVADRQLVELIEQVVISGAAETSAVVANVTCHSMSVPPGGPSNVVSRRPPARRGSSRVFGSTASARYPASQSSGSTSLSGPLGASVGLWTVTVSFAVAPGAGGSSNRNAVSPS